MIAEHSFSSKLDNFNYPEFFISKSLNSEDDSTNFDNNYNLNNLESNQSLIYNPTINFLNQNEIINNNESERNNIFGSFNDKSNISINFNIPSHFNQHSPINTKKNEIELSEKAFLNKKRNLFKIEYPNEFFIFNRGSEKKNKRNKIENEENQNKTRKENADNIRKKIKSRFIKALKLKINQKLKLAGSKKMFALLPQIFVINVSKDLNIVMFNKTFKEIFSINFSDKEKENDANLKKYKKNIDTIKYLENNKDISEKSNYNCYKNLKFYQIFDEYLRSKEFENEIENLEFEGEEDNYIHDYIKLACNLNNFFSQ